MLKPTLLEQQSISGKVTVIGMEYKEKAMRLSEGYTSSFPARGVLSLFAVRARHLCAP